MDGLNTGSSSKDKGVVVIGATNRVSRTYWLLILCIDLVQPYDLDQAILRRLPCRMLVDLPSKAERESERHSRRDICGLTEHPIGILESHLKGEELDGLDLQEVAADTEGYSGSDLKSESLLYYIVHVPYLQ
jgi:SpoVK/Ycf46/Vps4 family AAA+-type ATPase